MLRYLRLIFILFMDIFISLKILKNILSAMKANMYYDSGKDRENQLQILEVKLFQLHGLTNFNSFAVKLCNFYSTERNSKQSKTNIF